MSARPYAQRRGDARAQATRERVLGAVRELLAEGTFHTSTMEEVADRAGVSRATLYLHFRSRLELIDAICETFARNPALLEVRKAVALGDADAALDRTITSSVSFWSSEDPILRQLYGVAAVDPAARALVDRQRADRRGVLEQLVATLGSLTRLRADVAPAQALALLLVLTSYETYVELQTAGLSDRRLTALLRRSAHEQLLA